MSILDKLDIFCEELLITSSKDSTNHIQLASGTDHLGVAYYTMPNDDMWLIVKCDGAAIAGTSLTIGLYNHTATSSFSAGTLIASQVVTGAQAEGVQLWKVQIPVRTYTKAYLGLYFTADTLSTGKVSAYFARGSEFFI